MLGADLIGFHTYDDMRHFLSSVSRLVGIPNAHGRIDKGRIIEVDSFPMGIDYQKYALSAASPKTIDKEIKYRASLGDQKLVLSIDRLDYSKGIPKRLEAFELFLKEHPEFQEKVSLIMVVVPSRDKVGQYKELKEEVDLLVGSINGNTEDQLDTSTLFLPVIPLNPFPHFTGWHMSHWLHQCVMA